MVVKVSPLAILLLLAVACRKDAPRKVGDSSAMAVLSAAFATATRPNEQDLAGSAWVLTRMVRTQAYLTGGNGPDEVQSDVNGLRGENRELSLVLTFERLPSGGLRVVQIYGGDWPRASEGTWIENRSLRYSQDVEADEDIRDDCRMRDKDHLVCVEVDHPGAASEFTRHALIPPRKRHDDIASDCVVGPTPRCGGITAHDIAMKASVCYRTPYDLSQPPGASRAGDAWLVLPSDSTTPRTQTLAAVLESGAEHLLQRSSGKDSLRYVMVASDRDVYAELKTDSIGFSGTVFDGRAYRSWGVDGERSPCAEIKLR